jgi:hypothetical protein
MCQQWIGIAGLVFDVIGVLMVVFEWHVMFNRHIGERTSVIDAFYARYNARAEGRKLPEDDDLDNYSMGKHMGMGLREDVQFRGRLVYVGTALLIVGFLLQAVAAIPGGITWLGLKSC